jgi:hypothetical protein
MTFEVPEEHRDRRGPPRQAGNNGVFSIRVPGEEYMLLVIASDGFGWEHVSVSMHERCPTWDEMCMVKSLFWDSEDTVMQLHPPESQWVNNHPYCLHLWRPSNGMEIPLPPTFTVGIKELGVLPR